MLLEFTQQFDSKKCQKNNVQSNSQDNSVNQSTNRKCHKSHFGAFQLELLQGSVVVVVVDVVVYEFWELDSALTPVLFSVMIDEFTILCMATSGSFSVYLTLELHLVHQLQYQLQLFPVMIVRTSSCDFGLARIQLYINSFP